MLPMTRHTFTSKLIVIKMQAQIRQLQGSDRMDPKDVSMFINTYDEGKLVDPMDAGHVLAALAVKAPKTLSGHFVSWDSEECSDFWDTK